MYASQLSPSHFYMDTVTFSLYFVVIFDVDNEFLLSNNIAMLSQNCSGFCQEFAYIMHVKNET